MEKTIIVNGTEIPVKASMGALQLYRAQFNSDLIQDLNEIHDKLHPDPFMDAIKKAGINPGQLDQDEITKAILQNVDYSVFNNEDALPDADTQIKTLQIVWVMAKTAGNGVKRFDLWCDDFGFLPIRDMADRCYEIWQEANTGTVEIKN